MEKPAQRAGLPRVFEPFYRTESARRLGRAGVGLGPAVAHRIASALGGTLTAESEPGRGSRFVVRLSQLARPTTVDQTGIVAGVSS